MYVKIIIGVLGAVFSVAFLLFIMQNGEISNMNTNTTQNHQDGIASYEISPSEVVKKIENNENIVLLDVRTPEEYEEVHLENATLLPVQELSQESLASVGLGENAKDKEIIIYCRSGARSKTAYDIMKSLGYTNIKSVAGGMIHWEEDQYPFTESGAYRAPDGESDAGTEANAPRISFDQTFYDFGVVSQYGGTVEKTFTVTNTGAQTLTVGTITTSCSCTSAVISSSAIAPGENAALTVVFDPNFHEEPTDVFKRTVFIPTNDPTQPEAEVVIQVDIKEGE